MTSRRAGHGIVLTEEQKRARRDALDRASPSSLGALVVLFYVDDAGEGPRRAEPAVVDETNDR